MNDLISREAAIKAIYALHEDGEDGISSYLNITDVGSYPYLKDDYTEGLADCVSEIENLPSATNTKAEWIKKQENLDGTIIYECSNCEHEIELTASPWHYDVYYCEACGADMGLDDE